MSWVMPVEDDQLLSRIAHRGVAGRSEGLNRFDARAVCSSLIGWADSILPCFDSSRVAVCRRVHVEFWYLGGINIGHDAR